MRVYSTLYWFLDDLFPLGQTHLPIAPVTWPTAPKTKALLSRICQMFSKDVTNAEPTKLLTCDASAGGQVSEKSAHGWRRTGIRVCVPGSRATTASCLQPLHKRGHSSPGPPGAAQLLPRAGGRAPRREIRHAGGHPGPFLQKLREGGYLTWGGGQGRSPKHGKDAAPVPSPPESPGLLTLPPKGGQVAHSPAWGPQAALAPPRPRGGRARLPHRFVPHPGKARLGALPASTNLHPGGRSPNVSRPARPNPQCPQGRTLQGAFPAPQPLSAPAAPPLVRAPLPAAVRKLRPRTYSPSPTPPRSALARRGDPGRSGRAVRGSARNALSQSGRVESSAERSIPLLSNQGWRARREWVLSLINPPDLGFRSSWHSPSRKAWVHASPQDFK